MTGTLPHLQTCEFQPYILSTFQGSSVSLSLHVWPSRPLNSSLLPCLSPSPAYTQYTLLHRYLTRIFPTHSFQISQNLCLYLLCSLDSPQDTPPAPFD
nr:MAG TPA: hypothetical protein [Caudoviricetes sp.]